MHKILTLNSISPVINDVFDDDYQVSADAQNPEGILLRSFKMHDYSLSPETIAVARAGAGTNNIPVDAYAEKGVVVFNTPGANANAVKELVISALTLGSRKIVDSIEWVKTLKGDPDLSKDVEKGKANFAGQELSGRKLGVIGLGAIGALVANAAIDLGMQVYGYDPFLSVYAALRLSSQVKIVKNLDDLAAVSDYITIHIPYIPDQNKGFVGADFIGKMKQGSVLINCARGELVSNADLIAAVKSGKIARYFCDFPADELISVENVICTPHLGASTLEAEDNCAVMASKQLIDYIENGNIVNSVNYPNCSMPRTDKVRLVVLHKNVNNILAQITASVGGKGINIAHLSNQSKGNYAVTLIDADQEIPADVAEVISAIPDVIKVRIIK
ncbi:MAG: 3-phosphoglycerate dehydrogenase [Clostridia bacterium]|nr:3-phosphoglycerate dehydrogenase [Clostridia bacterium]